MNGKNDNNDRKTDNHSSVSANITINHYVKKGLTHINNVGPENMMG